MIVYVVDCFRSLSDIVYSVFAYAANVLQHIYYATYVYTGFTKSYNA